MRRRPPRTNLKPISRRNQGRLQAFGRHRRYPRLASIAIPTIDVDRRHRPGSHTMTMIQRSAREGSHIGRAAAFLYGLVAYAVFLISFLYAVGFVEGLLVPKDIDTGAAVAM